MVAMMPPADDVGLMRSSKEIALATAMTGLIHLAQCGEGWQQSYAQGRLRMIETILSAEQPQK